MADTMFMPETWEAFLRDYEFKDSKEVYTNGAMLISSLRARQMMEHYTRQKPGRWIKKKMKRPVRSAGSSITAITMIGTSAQIAASR